MCLISQKYTQFIPSEFYHQKPNFASLHPLFNGYSIFLLIIPKPSMIFCDGLNYLPLIHFIFLLLTTFFFAFLVWFFLELFSIFKLFFMSKRNLLFYFRQVSHFFCFGSVLMFIWVIMCYLRQNCSFFHSRILWNF